MALKKEQKKEKIEQLKKAIDNQKSIVFVDFSGLKTKNISELKKELQRQQSEFKVIKKSLAEIAFNEKGIKFKRDDWQGQVAFIFGYDDEVMPFKIAYSFSKENENLKIVGGFIDGGFLTKEEAISMAKLPGKEELRAKLVSAISAPIYNFVYTLSGNMKGLVYALQAIANK